MKLNDLINSVWNYNRDCVGVEFPKDMSCFYYDIWNDWRHYNKISLNDALDVWDWFMKSEWIENDDDYSLEHKTIQQEIKKLKIECDFE